jgi:tRNA dimethylallyltransferase
LLLKLRLKNSSFTLHLVMSPNTQHPAAIFLMGPTASGKTALAVQLAQRLDGEIISVDSALVYKGMDIGTAKPNLAERGGIPHYLIDILDPSEVFSTGQFKSQALALMAAICQRGKVPILVGGTFLYFNALSGGLNELPAANPIIRARLDAELATLGKEALHQRLHQVDPLAAVRIHPNDPQRIQRALEVYELTGQPLSAFFSRHTTTLPYHIIKLALAPQDRAWLHQTIAQRFHTMLQQGLLAEVAALYQRGDLSEKMPAIRAVGYRQVWAYLQGVYDYDVMVEKAIVATRQLAKRQFTWLRKETDAVNLVTGQLGLLDAALAAVENGVR